MNGIAFGLIEVSMDDYIDTLKEKQDEDYCEAITSSIDDLSAIFQSKLAPFKLTTYANELCLVIRERHEDVE